MGRAKAYSLLGAAVIASVACGCSKDEGYTEQQRQCLARKFPSLPAGLSQENLDECVAACTECLAGTIVTCSTSCRLRGARK